MKSLLLFLMLIAGMGASAQEIPVPTDVSAIIRSHMVQVQGGDFAMGNKQGKHDAKWVHQVHLKDYYIGKYEVTQMFWNWVMHYDADSMDINIVRLLVPAQALVKSSCDDCAKYDISWDSLQLFFSKLNMITKGHDGIYRLPTEAEWEFAACGGNMGKGYKYSGGDNLDSVAWHKDNSSGVTHPVGQKKPNELGLYDMSGNVWELCSDWYSADYYWHSPKENPKNKQKEKFHVVRGGSWLSGEERCRTRARNRNIKDHYIKHNCGFRLVCGQ